ncbi:ATP-binding cassette domain-containing protein [Paenibacillus sp. P26]|nr:ATP-binding cassette domain-containing protein [Paenibacillus sp. P26]
MIRFEQVNKTYEDGYVALKSINIEFHKGELTVLIGPSGRGKSTLMKHINRLNKPTKGRILIHNKDIAQMDPVELRRKIGYVIQNVGLFPHMTIAKNVAIVPGRFTGIRTKSIGGSTSTLALVNLDPDTYRNRYPHELSGGQQRASA